MSDIGHMSPDTELEKLRNEWRDRMALDMKVSKDAIERIERNVQLIREQFVRNEHVKDLDVRLRGLEDFRARVWGMFAAASAIGGIIVSIVGMLFKK